LKHRARTVESPFVTDLPLAGVRVLEIGGGIPAAFATRWLAGFGADVVRPEGPPGTLTADEEIYLLSGKRRIDATPADLRRLALCADILVEDGPPGRLTALGLDPRDLLRERPELVVVSITPFGQTGPYAGYDATNIVSFAMGGIMSLTGHPSREPLVNGGSQAQYLGGLNGFSAALAAYFGALIHGQGDWIDISLQECAAGMLELYGPGAEYNGTGPFLRAGNTVRALWALYPCADGYGGVCCLERQVEPFFKLVGPLLTGDERFQRSNRRDHDDELQAILYGWFAAHTKADLLALGPEHKIPFGAVLTPGELLDSQSLHERGFFDTIETVAGEARAPGRPFLGVDWRPAELHAPGADTAAVLDEWLGVPA
jgi:crotonobetainyl-CoA:carnitine CoA-transferase CaiB-like acyl-CoA transferase